MPSKIKPKRSFTAGAVPTTSDLEASELAINWTDGKAYTKNASGNIVSVTLGGGGGGSLSGSVTIPGLGDPAFGNVAMLLHMDGTGGTFVDSSGTPKTITSVANATQSATQSKFGGKSLSCPAGGYLSVDGGSDVSFGSGDFTVELWAYPTETPNGSALYTSEYSNNAVGFTIAFSNSGTLGSVSGSTLFTGFFNGSWRGIATGVSLTLNAWNHIAVCRINNEYALYLNGTRLGTYYNDAVMPIKQTVWIGKDWGSASATTGSFVGFVDEVRVTKGVGRYSGSGLVVPTSAFLNSSSLTLPVTITST
jgi:hypothetical protein